jgi:hypothetical protein
MNQSLPNHKIAPERKKKEKEDYWPEDTEDAVREYLSMDTLHLTYFLELYEKDKANNPLYDPSIHDGYISELEASISESCSMDTEIKKQILFNSRIKGPLNKLVEMILKTYKLERYDVDFRTAHNDCMSHVIDKFYRFNPSLNHKAYSYFGTIAKHYGQNKVKELDSLKKRNLNYDDYSDSMDKSETENSEDNSSNDQIFNLFYHIVMEFENSMDNRVFNDNDKKLLNAMITLFKGSLEDIEEDDFQKSRIWNFLGDNAKLTKEEVSKSMSKIKNLYREKRKEFFKTIDEN